MHRSPAWRSSAESALPESATLLKRARPYCEGETEDAIQASLSAALEELDHLEQGPKPPRPSQKMKIPRGMPPLPGGRAMPPLPFARVISLRPRKSATPLPATAVPAPAPAPPTPEHPAPAQADMLPAPGRWPAVVAAVLGVLLLGAAVWLTFAR